jgi:hypothetical protein
VFTRPGIMDVMAYQEVFYSAPNKSSRCGHHVAEIAWSNPSYTSLQQLYIVMAQVIPVRSTYI